MNINMQSQKYYYSNQNILKNLTFSRILILFRLFILYYIEY